MMLNPYKSINKRLKSRTFWGHFSPDFMNISKGTEQAYSLALAEKDNRVNNTKEST